MPSVAVPASSNAVATATSAGIVTITNAVNVFAGAWGWLYKTDGSASKRVKILSTSVSGGTTTCKVRVFPDGADEYGFGQAVTVGGNAPNYDVSDVSAFNTGSRFDTSPQQVPIDPSYVTRTFA